MIYSALMDRAAGRPALLLVVALFVGSWAYFRFRAKHASAWTPATADAVEP
jgi:hypothetical protein